MANAYQIMIAVLLMCPLLVASGIFVTYLLLRKRHVTRLQFSPAPYNYIRVLNKPQRQEFLGSNRPTCWLAIRNSDLSSVQTALSLVNPEPCSLSQGLAANGLQKLFVSPPIAGWILVVGSALPDTSDDVDLCFRFLTKLSAKLGHVQYFKINSALNHHAWVKAECGGIVRGYAWAGKTLWNQGEMTQSEKSLRIKCYDYCEKPEFSMFDILDNSSSNSEKVHQLAALWSINPDNIDERFIEQRIGVVGHLSKIV